jgi:hypothetical protein
MLCYCDGAGVVVVPVGVSVDGLVMRTRWPTRCCFPLCKRVFSMYCKPLGSVSAYS